MSIETITDHGAKPNPDDPSALIAEQNGQALIDAIAAAGAGGTVHVPEGEFYLQHAPGSSVFTAFGQRDPIGVSIVGDGPEVSTLGVSRHINTGSNANLLRYEKVDHGTVTLRDIKFDGNYQNLPDLANSGGGSDCISSDGTGSFKVDNVWFRGWYQAAANIRDFHGEFYGCTFEEQGIGVHNDLNGGSAAHHISCRPNAQNPPVTVENCLFKRNSGSTVNIRYGDGDVVVRNCVSIGMGSQAFKVSSGGTIEVHNSYFKANTRWLEENLVEPDDIRPLHGRHFFKKLFERGERVPTVITKNVEFHDSTFPAVYVRGAPIRWKGDMVAFYNAAGTVEKRSVIIDHSWTDGSIDMDLEHFSVHDSDGVIFMTNDRNSGGTIKTLHRDGNEGLGYPGDIDIKTDVNEADPFQTEVPTPDEVGINTSENFDSSEREAAVFTTDFSDADFAEFTPRWESQEADWGVKSADSAYGNTVLELVPNSEGRHALSWDDVGEATDVEMLVLSRVVSNEDDLTPWCRSIVRGGDNQTGYFSGLHDERGFPVRKYVDKSLSLLAQDGTVQPSTWYWKRFRVDGDRIFSKDWKLGEDEPAAWNIDVTDTDIADAGWVGIGGYSSDTQQFDYLAVGVSGASPEVPETETGMSLYDDWTPRWKATKADWTVISNSDFTGSHALVFEHDGDERDRYAISCDAVGRPTDVEVVDRFRVPTFTEIDKIGFHARVHLRSSSGVGNENGYWIELEEQEDAFRLAKYTNGSKTNLARFGTPKENTFFYRRFRADGDQLKAKVWLAEESEPVDWDVSLTDRDHSEGWVGLGSFDTQTCETDIFSVATGGDSVMLENIDKTPSISWKAPIENQTLSETVSIELEASDVKESHELLTVDFRINDDDWTNVAYNPEMGYYEADLDTTHVDDGDHTLEARVTDSSGNKSLDEVTVAVSNDPVIERLAVMEVNDSEQSGFDLNWAVADEGGDLDSVVSTLQYQGEIVAADSTRVSGSTASGTHRLRVSGAVDEVQISVNDTSNRSKTVTERV